MKSKINRKTKQRKTNKIKQAKTKQAKTKQTKQKNRSSKKSNRKSKRLVNKSKIRLVNKSNMNKNKIKGGNISLPFTPASKEELMQAVNEFRNKENIEKTIETYGKMDTWIVSSITDMSELFKQFIFDNTNDIVSNWDVSNVENMSYMFYNCPTFNQPLNSWIVSKVENMAHMFSGCSKFNQSLASWNVSKVKNMVRMFFGCRSLYQDFSSWKLAVDADTYYMFYGSPVERKRSFYPTITRPPVSINPHVNSIPITYNNVVASSIPITENAEMKVDSNAKAHDLINLEDVSVITYLQEDNNNIAFTFNNTFYITDKDRLKQLCNDDSFVKYSCNQVYDRLMVTPDMYDFKIPYLLGNSFGCPCGLIELSKLKTIIENNGNEYQCIEIVPFNPPKSAPSTVSLQMLGPTPNAVGASHCQDGQGETINEVRRIIF